MSAFGIEIPDDKELFSENSAGSAPDLENKEAPSTIENNGTNQPKTTAEQLADLDKLEKFRFNGREWTPKELGESTLRWEDYTRKTMQVAEARKFAENFHYDLEKVASNPRLMSEFKNIYPKQYHQVAENLLKRMSQTGAPKTETTSQATQLPPEFLERLDKLEGKLSESEKAAQETQINSIVKTLDLYFEKLEKKYELANSEVVENRAMAMLERAKANGEELTITEAFLDKLFKESHEQTEKRFQAVQKAKITQQKTASLNAREAGRGGDSPATPASKMTMKEAREKLMADVGA